MTIISAAIITSGVVCMAGVWITVGYCIVLSSDIQAKLEALGAELPPHLKPEPKGRFYARNAKREREAFDRKCEAYLPGDPLYKQIVLVSRLHDFFFWGLLATFLAWAVSGVGTNQP